jgi:hypothetical protein
MSLQCNLQQCGSPGVEATDFFKYIKLQPADIKPNTAVGKTGYIWKAANGETLLYCNLIFCHFNHRPQFVNE